MKLKVLLVETGKEDFSQSAQELYLKKIKRFTDIEIQRIKSPALDRDQKTRKQEEESKKILEKLKENDFLVLLDERGRELNSIEFSQTLSQLPASKNIIFLIGGAFGVSENIKKRSNMKLSLSRMVMNHHVASVVLLEQIYRAITIQEGIPYHNE